MVRTLTIVLLLKVSLLSGGCATSVALPHNVEDPVAVYIVDYGRHSSLLLPVVGSQSEMDLLGRVVLREYAFGDWVYYAQNEDSICNGIRALLWKTEGTIGRRDLEGLGPSVDEAPIEAEGRIQRTLGVERVIGLAVERVYVESLLFRLDKRFDAGRMSHSSLYNPRADMDFVPDARSYSVLRHCNHEVREWLVELGVEAKGAPIISEYRIERRR